MPRTPHAVRRCRLSVTTQNCASRLLRARLRLRLFIPLGQASLYVYIVQSMFTFVLVNRAQANPWLAAAISAGMIGAVWLAVRRRFLFQIIPR